MKIKKQKHTEMGFEYIAFTRRGITRMINEDRVMVNNEVISAGCRKGKITDGFMAVVCDGVGGVQGGNIAAEMLAESFKHFSPDTISPFMISNHIHGINQLIVLSQDHVQSAQNMATTVAGLVLHNNRFLVFNLGDTRVYRINTEEICMLSRDYTMHQTTELYPHATSDNVITGYVGGDGCSCYPTIKTGNIQEGDYFLICSDGIYKKSKDILLKKIILSNDAIDQKAESIMDLSLKNGSSDDMSIVLINCFLMESSVK